MELPDNAILNLICYFLSFTKYIIFFDKRDNFKLFSDLCNNFFLQMV